MKRILFAGILIATLSLFIKAESKAASISNYPAGAAASGIGNTRHNMATTGDVIHTNATTEICVFCHTPHHSNTATAPLWNKSTAASTSYEAYGETIAGTQVSAVGGVSLACLSCHDGVTSFDSIVNAPGPGGVAAPGSENRDWKFRMPTLGPDLSASVDHFGATACVTCHVDFLGLPEPAARLTIGTSLTNDHPISIPYNAGVAGSLRALSTIISQINLSADLNINNTNTYWDNMNQNLWAVKGFISSSATISDLLRNNKVECGSCHDPHFRNLSWDETEILEDFTYCSGEQCFDGNFLRRVGGNTGSGLCRTCHEK